MDDHTHVFTLPESGQEVHLKPLTTAAQIKIANNPRIRELARDSHAISFTAADAARIATNPSSLFGAHDASSGGAGPQSVDPIRNFVTEAALLELFSIIFSHLVVQVGTTQRPPATFFQNLPSTDLAAITNEYMKMNFPHLFNDKEATQNRPLERSEN